MSEQRRTLTLPKSTVSQEEPAKLKRRRRRKGKTGQAKPTHEEMLALASKNVQEWISIFRERYPGGHFTAKGVAACAPEGYKFNRLERKEIKRQMGILGSAEHNEKQTAEAIEARLKRYSNAGRWIKATWPEVFDYDDPKPLAVGIDKQIYKAMEEATEAGEELDFSRKNMRKVLMEWTNRWKYKNALETYSHRYNLDGTESGPVFEERDEE